MADSDLDIFVCPSQSQVGLDHFLKPSAHYTESQPQSRNIFQMPPQILPPHTEPNIFLVPPRLSVEIEDSVALSNGESKQACVMEFDSTRNRCVPSNPNSSVEQQRAATVRARITRVKRVSENKKRQIDLKHKLQMHQLELESERLSNIRKLEIASEERVKLELGKMDLEYQLKALQTFQQHQ